MGQQKSKPLQILDRTIFVEDDDEKYPPAAKKYMMDQLINKLKTCYGFTTLRELIEQVMALYPVETHPAYNPEELTPDELKEYFLEQNNIYRLYDIFAYMYKHDCEGHDVELEFNLTKYFDDIKRDRNMSSVKQAYVNSIKQCIPKPLYKDEGISRTETFYKLYLTWLYNNHPTSFMMLFLPAQESINTVGGVKHIIRDYITQHDEKGELINEFKANMEELSDYLHQSFTVIDCVMNSAHIHGMINNELIALYEYENLDVDNVEYNYGCPTIFVPTKNLISFFAKLLATAPVYKVSSTMLMSLYTLIKFNDKMCIHASINQILRITNEEHSKPPRKPSRYREGTLDHLLRNKDIKTFDLNLVDYMTEYI